MCHICIDQAKEGGLMLPSGDKAHGVWMYDRKTDLMVNLEEKTAVKPKDWDVTFHLRPATKKQLAGVEFPDMELLHALGEAGYAMKFPRNKVSDSVWNVETPIGTFQMLSSNKATRIKTFRMFVWAAVRKNYL